MKFKLVGLNANCSFGALVLGTLEEFYSHTVVYHQVKGPNKVAPGGRPRDFFVCIFVCIFVRTCMFGVSRKTAIWRESYLANFEFETNKPMQTFLFLG